jgi:hypothetical protein
VQRTVAQLPWRQNIALIEHLDNDKKRLWYAEQTLRQGCSQPIFCLQIERGAHEPNGKAMTTLALRLPASSRPLKTRSWSAVCLELREVERL